MCPNVRCFNRFLSVKVASNVKCSLLILSLPPFLWVSPAEILSLCEVSRMTEHWDGPSYILHPTSFRLLHIQYFNPSVSTIFQCVVKNKIVEIYISILCCSYRPWNDYIFLLTLFIPLHGTRRHASVASINYVCSLTKTNVKCYWFEPAIFQGEEKTRSQLYRDLKKVPNFKSHFLSYGYIIFARGRLGCWF